MRSFHIKLKGEPVMKKTYVAAMASILVLFSVISYSVSAYQTEYYDFANTVASSENSHVFSDQGISFEPHFCLDDVVTY